VGKEHILRRDQDGRVEFAWDQRPQRVVAGV
jgi:hypothetical protein